jgi:hypothetical protein
LFKSFNVLRFEMNVNVNNEHKFPYSTNSTFNRDNR